MTGDTIATTLGEVLSAKKAAEEALANRQQQDEGDELGRVTDNEGHLSGRVSDTRMAPEQRVVTMAHNAKEPDPRIQRKFAKGKLVLARRVDPVKEVPAGFSSMREAKRARAAAKESRKVSR